MAEATVPSSGSGRGLTQHGVSGPSWLASLGFPPADTVAIAPFIQLRFRRSEFGEISLCRGASEPSPRRHFPCERPQIVAPIRL